MRNIQHTDRKRQRESYVNFKNQYNLDMLRDIFKLCTLCNGTHGNNSLCQATDSYDGYDDDTGSDVT